MKTAYKYHRVFLVFALALSCGEEALAQSFPNKPIRFVVGYAPGGSTDILARIVGAKLAERLGQQVVVQNKPGADAMIGTEYVAKAIPNGYTLLIGGTATIINAAVYDNAPYDPVKDLIPITLFASASFVFLVHPSSPVTSIKELIALAKAKPGALFYANAASSYYLAAEAFKKVAGVNIVSVAYKGDSPAITAAVSGEVQMVVLSIAAPALAQLRAGKLRALVVTGRERSPFLPDIPTVAESGFDFEGGMWIGALAPAGTPSAIIDRLYSELSVVLKSESLRENFTSLGYETNKTGMPPAEFGAFYRTNFTKAKNVAKDLKIRAD